MVNGFLEFDEYVLWYEIKRKLWLRKVVLKNCIYLFVLEIYQWIVYIIFYKVFEGDYFVGFWIESYIELFEFDVRIWLGLYGFFWVMVMYIIGFVVYIFILISWLVV